DDAGQAIDAGFPVEIQISRGGENMRRFYRTLGRGRHTDLDLPTAGPAAAKDLQVRVIERISGRVVTDSIAAPAAVASPLLVVSATTPVVPYPVVLAPVLAQTAACQIIVADESTELRTQAEALAAGLKARGISPTIVLE